MTQNQLMTEHQLELEIRSQKSCPACGHHISVPMLFERP